MVTGNEAALKFQSLPFGEVFVEKYWVETSSLQIPTSAIAEVLAVVTVISVTESVLVLVT